MTPTAALTATSPSRPTGQSHPPTGHVAPSAPALYSTVHSGEESVTNCSPSMDAAPNEPGGYGATTLHFFSAQPAQIHSIPPGTAPAHPAQPASTQPNLRAGTSEAQASLAPSSGPVHVFTSSTTTATSATTSTNVAAPKREASSAEPALASPQGTGKLPHSAQVGSAQEGAEPGREHYQRGFVALSGQGGPRNEKEAFEHFVKAAALGNVHAKKGLAMLYLAGRGVEQNPKKAYELFLDVSLQGDANATCNLANMVHEGIGVPADKKKAFDLYTVAAKQGFAPAQDALASLYLDDEVVPRNEQKAVELFRKAALQGLTQAQHNMGHVYHSGIGVPKSVEMAAEWYGKAAEAGHSGSQCNLAGILRDGEDGLPKNLTRAFELYKMAAEQGHSGAQLNLSRMYEQGLGVARDVGSQIAWLVKACEARDPRALINMAVLMMNGDVVRQDKKQAARLFRIAAEDGNDHAQYYLGLCYAKGDGVEKSAASAKTWFRKAAEQGHVHAKDSLDILAKLEKGE